MPTIAATGALYAALGYTTVFDAAIATSAAGIAHRELNDLPILDKGIYLLAGDETAVLAALVKNDDALVQRLLAHTITHGRGWAVKVANPGGSVFGSTAVAATTTILMQRYPTPNHVRHASYSSDLPVLSRPLGCLTRSTCTRQISACLATGARS